MKTKRSDKIAAWVTFAIIGTILIWGILAGFAKQLAFMKFLFS